MEGGWSWQAWKQQVHHSSHNAHSNKPIHTPKTNKQKQTNKKVNGKQQTTNKQTNIQKKHSECVLKFMRCRLTNSPPGPHENRRLSGMVAPGASLKTTVVQVSENTFPTWACHTSSAVQVPKKNKQKHGYKYLPPETILYLYPCCPVWEAWCSHGGFPEPASDDTGGQSWCYSLRTQSRGVPLSTHSTEQHYL